DHRRELRVAEPCEEAAKASEHERVDDRGPGVLRGSGAREHEDAGPDDRADAKRREIQSAQRPLEGMLPLSSRLLLQEGNALRRPQTHCGISRGGYELAAAVARRRRWDEGAARAERSRTTLVAYSSAAREVGRGACGLSRNLEDTRRKGTGLGDQ